MKYLKILLFLMSVSTTKFLLACDNETDNESKTGISAWLGENSLFSQAYKDGKCVLDKALINIPIEQRRVIANLIAKSYGLEAKRAEEIINYNY